MILFKIIVEFAYLHLYIPFCYFPLCLKQMECNKDGGFEHFDIKENQFQKYELF